MFGKNVLAAAARRFEFLHGDIRQAVETLKDAVHVCIDERVSQLGLKGKQWSADELDAGLDDTTVMKV